MGEPVSIQIETNGPEFARAMAEAPARLARHLRTGLTRYMSGFVAPNGAWQRSWMRGRPGLRRRAGALAQSFVAVDATTGSTLGDIASRAFTTSKYARIHELGGVIRPRPGRVWFYTRESKKYGQRTFARPAMLAWEDPEGSGRWHFARQVTIPPRMHFLDSFKRDEGGRSIMLRTAVQRALGEGPAPGALPTRRNLPFGPSPLPAAATPPASA